MPKASESQGVTTPAKEASKAPSGRSASTRAAAARKEPAKKPASSAAAKKTTEQPSASKPAKKAVGKVVGKAVGKAAGKTAGKTAAPKALAAARAPAEKVAKKGAPAPKKGGSGAARTGPARTGAARTGAPRTGDAKTGDAKTGDAKTGDAKFLEEQRALLLEERRQYEHQAAALKAEADQLAAEMEPGDIQFDDESGEGDTVNVERERDLALSAQARAAVDEIDRALAKIEAGTYGLCERCGQPIPRARLKALPYAALCVTCKSGGLSSRR